MSSSPFRLLFVIAGMVFLLLSACQTRQKPLPILGNHAINGKDTLYHTIPDFAFINQDSQVITQANFAGKAYVVDFFFTSCPTICPKVTQQMLRIHDAFKNDDRLALLAHSIDTRRDTVGRLKAYAEGLGVSAPKWHFVTGDKGHLYDIADDYFSIAIEDPTAPGGFDHSGRLILIDQNRHIRSFCNGTDPKEVDVFLEDIKRLLAEMESL